MGLSILASLSSMLVFYFKGVPKLVPFADSNIVMLVETAIMDYSAHNRGTVPEEGTNRAWTAVLKDREIAGVKLSLFVKDGEFVNLMRLPLSIETDRFSKVEVISPGPDNVMGTEDDIDTDSARRYLEEREAKINGRQAKQPDGSGS